MSEYETEESLAKELSKLWEELQEDMGEMAAYHVACSQLDIDPDDGWELLAREQEK